MSHTHRSPAARNARIRRRFGSATSLRNAGRPSGSGTVEGVAGERCVCASAAPAAPPIRSVLTQAPFVRPPQARGTHLTARCAASCQGYSPRRCGASGPLRRALTSAAIRSIPVISMSIAIRLARSYTPDHEGEGAARTGRWGPDVDEAAKKVVFRLFTYGLYAVTCRDGDRRNTFTANWLTQVSFAPPLLALSVERDAASLELDPRLGRVRGLRAGGRAARTRRGARAIDPRRARQARRRAVALACRGRAADPGRLPGLPALPRRGGGSPPATRCSWWRASSMRPCSVRASR